MTAAYVEIVRDPNPRWLAWHFDVWFIIAGRSCKALETAARLLGFVDRLRHEKNLPRLPGVLPWFHYRSKVGQALSGERLQDLMLEGEALGVADAQALGRRGRAISDTL